MYKQYKHYQTFLILADVLMTVVVFASMVKLRPYLPGREILPGEVFQFNPAYLVTLGVCQALFFLTGVYDLRVIPFSGGT